MTQDTKAPERVWILRDVRGGVHVFDERGDAPEDTRDDVKYVRADLLTAAEARAEAAEAERDRLMRLVEDARRTLQDSEESIVTFMGVHGYSTDSGAQLVLDEVRATLANMENTDV